MVAASQSTEIFTLELPPKPVLKATVSGEAILISWIIPSRAFVLQENADPTSTNWTEVGLAPRLNYSNLNYEVTLKRGSAMRFYRLALVNPTNP
jgi:hypothetical protein